MKSRKLPEAKMAKFGKQLGPSHFAPRRLPKALKRRLKRRQAIEPIIGHMKSDHRMDRNFLSGKVGDAINAILAACGFNMAKLFRAAALLARLSLLGYLFEVKPRGEQSLDQALVAA